MQFSTSFSLPLGLWLSAVAAAAPGCSQSKRGSDIGTQVQIGPNATSVQKFIGSGTGDVPQFDWLWGNMSSLCGQTECGGDDALPKKYCVPVKDPPSSYSPEICIEPSGSFESVGYDNMFTLAKEAFYRGMYWKTSDYDYLNNTYGPNYLNIVTGPDSPAGSGYNLMINFVIEEYESHGCPEWVNAINSVGALVPELSEVFGIAEAVCSLL